MFNFWQKLWTNPFGKCKIFDLFKSMFCSLKWLDFYLSGHKTLYFGRNISNMRCSVSSPDETLRRELKIRRAAEYFLRTSSCLNPCFVVLDG